VNYFYARVAKNLLVELTALAQNNVATFILSLGANIWVANIENMAV